MPPPPAELATLAEALGPLNERLAQHAADPNQGSELARIVGLDAARRLAQTYGRDWLKVPLARDWRIRVYRARGDSYRTIARKLGVHEDTVHRHLSAAQLTQAQGSLF